MAWMDKAVLSIAVVVLIAIFLVVGSSCGWAGAAFFTLFLAVAMLAIPILIATRPGGGRGG